MAIQDHLDTVLARAVRQVGGQSAMAIIVNKHQSTIHDWLRDERPLPAEHVLAVEAATGISRHDLRPDIYPIDLPLSPVAKPGEAPAAVVSPRPAAGDDKTGLEGFRS